MKVKSIHLKGKAFSYLISFVYFVKCLISPVQSAIFAQVTGNFVLIDMRKIVLKKKKMFIHVINVEFTNQIGRIMLADMKNYANWNVRFVREFLIKNRS